MQHPCGVRFRRYWTILSFLRHHAIVQLWPLTRYHDALMRKEQENAKLASRCSTLETEARLNSSKSLYE